MVDVTVRIDDRDDGPVTAVGSVERQCGRGGFGADQRIDDDDAGVALDEADVGQVEAAHLVDALDHLVEALLGREGGLPPQAGVHRRRRVTGQERVDVVVPHDAAVGGLDDARLLRGNESPVGVVEVRGVVERQGRQVLAVCGLDGGGRWVLLHDAEIATRTRPPVVDSANGCTPSSDRTRRVRKVSVCQRRDGGSRRTHDAAEGRVSSAVGRRQDAAVP